MAIATAIANTFRIKKESAWGTFAGAAGAQIYRRNSTGLGLSKQTYASAEIRDDYQRSDFRHGFRSVDGSLMGDLSGGTYQLLIEAALRKTSAVVAAMTAMSLTIAVDGAAPQYTITRAAGDWLAGGVRSGMVGILSIGTLNALNTGRWLITQVVSATVLKVRSLNSTATMFAEGPIASCTATFTGKVCIVPSTSHTDDSFSIEHWRPDISVSELFVGCKVNTLGLKLPASGMTTLEAAFLGKDMTRNAAQQFTSPTAATSTGVFAAVNGALRIGGANVATITGLDLTINGNMSSGPVVGSNTSPDIFEGGVEVSGNLTAYYQDGSLYDAFIAETEIDLMAVLLADNSLSSHFVSVYCPRIKLGGAKPDDSKTGIIQTIPFTALKSTAVEATSGIPATTIQIHDSQFV